jgi:IMP dehydrogenase
MQFFVFVILTEEKLIMKILEGLTFDDVLLIPAKSNILPHDVDLSCFLGSYIKLNIPIISAAMDTVTEWRLAAEIAWNGGLGIIHKNMPVEAQAKEVEKVKRESNFIIEDPICLLADNPVRKAKELMDSYDISGIPVLESFEKKRLIGLVTRRDVKYKDDNEALENVMTRDLDTASYSEIKNWTDAEEWFAKYNREKLLIIDNYSKRLCGLITQRDIDKIKECPNAAKDQKGRLLAGAAVGVSDNERIDLLMKAGVDVICIDTAHGHSKNVINTLKEIKKNWKFRGVIIAGNVVTADGALDLIKAGADAVKVGVGPGSTCTTRQVAGVGVPQITAIEWCSEVSRKNNIPLIADGGIKYSGDISKALACGANAVMLGNLLAGTNEAPGETVTSGGKKYKIYRGMGSSSAMKRAIELGVSGRGYLEKAPEGVEGKVPYKGSLIKVLQNIIDGVRAGFGYCGARNILELQSKAVFIKNSDAALREAGVNVEIVRE